MLFHYQKQCKPTLIQFFSNTIPKQKNNINPILSNTIPTQEAIFSKTKKQHKTMLNQYFSNTKKIFKTIVNQYFSNSIPIPKEKEYNTKPRLFQYYSNAKNN